MTNIRREGILMAMVVVTVVMRRNIVMDIALGTQQMLMHLGD
jgi:hypothetical protein